MGKSKIEWTDATWNPIRARNLENGPGEGGVGHFCEHVSEGCRNCYAEAMQRRFRNFIRFARQDRDKVEIFLDQETLLEPLTWRKPRLVFVCSMTDLFGDWVEEDWLDRIFAVMALCPQHHFQILTKRPERMRAYLTGDPSRFFDAVNGLAGTMMHWDAMPERDDWPMRNLTLGTSIEDQKTADLRLPELLATPAAFRNVSYEPALGPVDWTKIRIGSMPSDAVFGDEDLAGSVYIDALRNVPSLGWRGLDQVIAGGESDRPGQEARPANPDWFRSARDQCVTAGVPFFLKQWGAWAPMDQIGATRLEKVGEGRGRLYNAEGPMFKGKVFEARLGADAALMVKVGKANAGRALDGWIWDQMPKGQRPSADSDSGSAGPRESDQVRLL